MRRLSRLAEPGQKRTRAADDAEHDRRAEPLGVMLVDLARHPRPPQGVGSIGTQRQRDAVAAQRARPHHEHPRLARASGSRDIRRSASSPWATGRAARRRNRRPRSLSRGPCPAGPIAPRSPTSRGSWRLAGSGRRCASYPVRARALDVAGRALSRKRRLASSFGPCTLIGAGVVRRRPGPPSPARRPSASASAAPPRRAPALPCAAVLLRQGEPAPPRPAVAPRHRRAA